MSDFYLNKLEESIHCSNLSRTEKLLRHPIKAVSKKLITETLSRINKPLKIKAKTFFEEWMTLVWGEVVSQAIFANGFFEEGLTRMLLRYLRPGMTFFDVGAHFGYFTMLASRIVGADGQVHAFEPTKSTYKILSLNSRHNKHIYLNNLAVWSEVGVMTFNDYGEKYSAFNSFCQARLDKKTREECVPIKYEIQMVSLDHYNYKNHLKPDFVKIDAESAEYNILLGMDRTIREIRPIITIEVGDMDLPNVVPSRELVTFLMKKRYEPYEFNGQSIVRHKVKNKYSYDNILFLPKK